MKKLLCIFLLAIALGTSSCKLIPKQVELFQDKVQTFPEAKSSERETLRQTAALAAKRADETFSAALSNNAPAEVISPAKDTAILTEAVAINVGPPLKPATATPVEQATRLNTATAKLNERVHDFKEDNNENSGKKIEGTGLFKVPYFVWLGASLIGFVFLFLVGTVIWQVVKVYGMANPAVGLGVNAAQMAGRTLSKGFSQVIKGGENFKQSVTEKYTDAEPQIKAVADEILELFRHEHQKAQDTDIQRAIQHLTQ